MRGSPRELGVVLAAGGRGERAASSTPKQFRPIAGVPMLLRSLRPFTQHPRVVEIAVVIPAADLANPPDWLEAASGGPVTLVAGGASRAESVARGVAALSDRCDIVLVHDAARPFVSREIIDAVVAVAEQGTSAVAAVPVSDTLKRVEEGTGRVLETVSRDGLWRAQTPQAFPRAVLDAAYARALEADATDEASMVEALGFPIAVVADVPTNFKVTTPDDFVIAEALAQL